MTFKKKSFMINIHRHRRRQNSDTKLIRKWTSLFILNYVWGNEYPNNKIKGQIKQNILMQVTPYHNGGNILSSCMMIWVRAPSVTNLTFNLSKSIICQQKKIYIYIPEYVVLT